MKTWRKIGVMVMLGYTLFVVGGCTSPDTSMTPGLRKWWKMRAEINAREIMCRPPRVRSWKIVDVPFHTRRKEPPMMFIMPRNCRHYPIWIQSMAVTQDMVKDLISGRILFQDCTFDGLRLDTASFTYVHFKNCSFKNTSFKNTRLAEVRFTRCDLTGAFFDPEIIDGPTKISILNGRNILESDVEWFIRLRGHDVVQELEDDDDEATEGDEWKTLL